MDGLTSHTIPQSEPSLPLHPRRGIQVQAAYSLMFPRRLSVSSAAPHALCRFHINKWFCPATPRATLGRAGVITVGRKKNLFKGKQAREREREWLKRKKNKTDCGERSVLSAWRHLRSVVPLCLLTPVSKQLWRLNGRSLTYGVSWDPERQLRVPGSSLHSLSCLLVLLSEAHFQTGAGLPSETWLLYDCRQKHSFYSTAALFVWTVQSIPFVYRYMWLFFFFLF